MIKDDALQAAIVKDKSTPIMDSLIRTWKMVSGVEDLEPSSIIQSFADSLMMVQVSFAVKREHGKSITVEDLKLCERIQDQAALIDSLPLHTAIDRRSRREGPPIVEDVPHAKGDANVFQRIRDLVSGTLGKAGLTWDDVEDVMPLPDMEVILCRRMRSTSWNVRWSYHAQVKSSVLQAAVKTSLTNHPTLRSMAVEDDGQTLLVTIRPSEQWWKASMTSGWEIETEKDLNTLLLDDPVLDSAVLPGPLVRVHVADIRDGTSGLVLITSHAIQDGTAMMLWMNDIITVLKAGSACELVPHAQYKDYAAAYFQHREGEEADKGVQYWTRKLQGIGSLPESTYWPPQKAPEWFKGVDSGWSRWDGTPARNGERTGATVSEKRKAQKGIRRIVPVQNLSLRRLKSEHNIPVYMLVKAAVALLNIGKTGGKEALFATLNAARTWPFRSDYSTLERERFTSNPLDIAGCTLELLLDRIPVPMSKSVLSFLKQVTKDEEQNSVFAHTPLFRIVDRLRDPISIDDTRTWAERDRDAESVIPLLRRQLFNWLPPAPNPQAIPKDMKMLELVTRFDNGLSIFGFVAPDKNLALGFMWDAEHLSFSEAERAMTELTSLVDRMGKEENWSMSVGELLRM